MERMVTRTVKGLSVEVLTLNIETAEPLNFVYDVGGNYANDDKLLKALRKTYETETVKLVAIVNKTETEQLYGMPETLFMQYAKKLPPRGVKEGVANET